MNTQWYETFFNGIVLDMWGAAVPREQTVLEADFLARALGVSPGSRILDVPCGLGRHTRELAARGFAMTGVDLSEDAIARARRAAADAGLSIDWRQADMRELPWEGVFDAAFCFGNSFAYMEPRNNAAFLKAVGRAIRPGGRFAMDTGIAAESVLPRMQPRTSAQVGDILFEEENLYHFEQSCIETRYSFTRDGAVTTRSGLQWVYTVREIRTLLAEAGLHVRAMHGSAEGAPYSASSFVLILVAEKTAPSGAAPSRGA